MPLELYICASAYQCRVRPRFVDELTVRRIQCILDRKGDGRLLGELPAQIDIRSRIRANSKGGQTSGEAKSTIDAQITGQAIRVPALELISWSLSRGSW